MSAYVVDRRTIDYLVQWIARHRSGVRRTNVIWQTWDEIPEPLQRVAGQYTGRGYYLNINELTENEIGAILLAQNVRSVWHRYPEDSADDLPGPIDQTRVWRYGFRPINPDLKATWVLSACRCLAYQSCETPDWEQTTAFHILEAIKDDAVHVLTADAPWGITDEDLEPSKVPA
jgi:hypothetical protein